MPAGGLGVTTLTCLVVANMIGAGIFTTSGFALADLGTPGRVMLAWLIGGCVAICGALSYGALARRLTESGGEYLFLSRAIHPLVGFVAGWVSLIAGFTGAIAFAAMAFESYVLPNDVRPDWLPADALAVLAVICAGAAHGWRLRVGAIGQNLAVVFKLLLIGVLIAYAVTKLPTHAWQVTATSGPTVSPPPFSIAAFGMTLMWISLSYSGFNAAVYVAGEARDAEYTVPRSMLIGTLVVTGIYLVLNAIFVYAAPADAIAGQQDVARRAALALGGEPLALTVRAIVAIALLTSVSSMIMAGPRVYAKMSADGLFPELFQIRDEVPVAAIALQTVLSIAVILVAGLPAMLSFLGFTLSVSAALTVASLFVLRHREGAERVPIPAYPFVPCLFVGGTLCFAGLAAFNRPLEPLVGILTIVIGIGAYYVFRHPAVRRL